MLPELVELVELDEVELMEVVVDVELVEVVELDEVVLVELGDDVVVVVEDVIALEEEDLETEALVVGGDNVREVVVRDEEGEVVLVEEDEDELEVPGANARNPAMPPITMRTVIVKTTTPPVMPRFNRTLTLAVIPGPWLPV